MTARPERILASKEAVRRLAVTKQHLVGKRPTRPRAASILNLVRELGCVQLDPINVVAPSHLIVLWSRLGFYPTRELEKLLWEDRTLFEYWAHQASIVLTEDYPFFAGMMRRIPGATPHGWGQRWEKREDRWMRSHAELQDYVTRELRARGPLSSRQFGHPTASRRRGSGWGASGDLSRVLQLQFLRGEVMVAGRMGRTRLWDLPERCFPTGFSPEAWSPEAVDYEAVQRSLSALGVATSLQIRAHFLRDRYPGLESALARLISESKVVRVETESGPADGELYILRKDIRPLEALDSGGWEPRTTLLSPFDNLICDRKRTEWLFGLRFRFEGYVPKTKRKFGPYSLPILSGDHLIGRVDPLFHRSRGTLVIRGVHAEKNAPLDLTTGREIRASIDDLARFLGAPRVEFTGPAPAEWTPAFG
ncbi:MAG: winged helix DNA-binding domain-containing protein [Thermoplasmata archaeon]|nr:winged helix DNA-binding domain-containing protein [Thermoplasmata archaeon]